MKTDVLEAVQWFSNGTADAVSASNFYDEVVYDLGDQPWMTNFVLLQATAQQHDLDLPTTTVALKGLVYDTEWLTESDLRSIEPLQEAWRYIGGREPFAYVLQDDPRQSVEVFPNPPASGQTVSAQVFGSTYPQRNFVCFITEYRANVPQYLEPGITFKTLAREMSRWSDHYDKDAMAVADKLGDLLLAMVA